MFPRVTHPSATNPEGSVRLACVRPAASVHSEPGSNSQVESTEVLSLTSNLRTSASSHKDKVFSVLCFGCRNNKSRKTVKLYQVIGSAAKATFPAGQICYVFRRRCAQTAHISLHPLSMSKSDLSDKISDGALNLSASSKALSSDFPNVYNRLRFASVRHRRCFASVRRCLGKAFGSRNSKKHIRPHFFTDL